MPLDKQARFLLEQAAAMNIAPMNTLSAEFVRQRARAQNATNLGQPEPVANVENRLIPGPDADIPIRIYTPRGTGPFPVLVYFHGGGWVLNDLDTHDDVCRSLTNRARCIVVSVDYRLAPEHKFPAAPNDAYAAIQWVVTNIAAFNGDPQQLAVGGDSAGGNLAAVITQRAHAENGPKILFQLLIYPVTDLRLEIPSTTKNDEDYGLNKEDMIWFKEQYLSDNNEQDNPLASPFLALDLSGLPPAFIITAEYDILRDEGERYAQRLQAAHVPVVLTRYEGMIHGFIRMPLKRSEQALIECATALRVAFALRRPR